MTFQQKLHESRHLIPVVLLIGAVLGSIYAGIATATEAAAVGVVGSLALSRRAGFAQLDDLPRIAAGRHAPVLHDRAHPGLARPSSPCPWATSACRATWRNGCLALGLSPFMLMVALALFYILLGCFLDGISMVVLTMGVILPTVQAAGFDLIWFGIFLVIVVEMAQITPPVGFNLFVLQGMTGRDLLWIARVTLPMFALMVGAVVLIWLFPGHRDLAAPADDALGPRPYSAGRNGRSSR
jgi:C4-dicarboxylate transporter DctM subunit